MLLVRFLNIKMIFIDIEIFGFVSITRPLFLDHTVVIDDRIINM